MTKVRAEIQRTDGNVFVQIRTPNPVVSTPIAEQYANSTAIGVQMASDIPPMPEPEPEPTPTIDDIFATSLPLFIESSRWGRYIFPGPASKVFENKIFQYWNPCPNFWDLYKLAKGIFRDLGIRVAKQSGTWVAHIPIKCLTDKVFIESGLEAIEKTLLIHTGMDPVAILNEIRARQFKETQDGIRNVKLGRKDGVKEAIGDAIGLIAMMGVSYLAFIVL